MCVSNVSTTSLPGKDYPYSSTPQSACLLFVRTTSVFSMSAPGGRYAQLHPWLLMQLHIEQLGGLQRDQPPVLLDLQSHRLHLITFDSDIGFFVSLVMVEKSWLDMCTTHFPFWNSNFCSRVSMSLR
jgi:hypothetical protein